MKTQYKIRIAEQRDVTSILDIYSPYVLNTAVSFEENIPTEEEMWERISEILEQHPYLVCEVNHQVIGYAYASGHRHREAYRWTKEVSVYVHPDFRGKGIASALYSKLFEVIKCQGVTNVLAGITIPNPESIQFHEKIGFKKVGEYNAIGYKLGKWHNVGWWELNLNPEIHPPKNKLIPFRDINQ